MIIWGSEIKVDGKRPDWLSDDVIIDVIHRTEGHWDTAVEAKYVFGWPNITNIRLPAEHFAYTAIAKGFTPWGGGNEAPEHWDGGEVLFRDGCEWPHELVWWTHDGGRKGGNPTGSDVIGYHAKTITQPSPADTVTVGRMSEAEFYDCYLPEGPMAWAKKIGLIRPTTKAETIATKTNLPLADVERVIAALGEEG